MSNPKLTVDLGYPTETRGRIPSFNSIEEEAEWWDTHDTADYDDGFKPVELVLGPEFGSILRVPLDAKDIDELERRADEMGVEPATLVRIWIEERLRKEAS